ncbi:hypothetical protein ACSNOJ_03735 [Streptomyces sp. URMC 128]|uniref:hypothetical protein n=1 Tax=Streptomyces sp. URMC 128 TaxID=3423404 RepID=UPI003F1A953E
MEALGGTVAGSGVAALSGLLGDLGNLVQGLTDFGGCRRRAPGGRLELSEQTGDESREPRNARSRNRSRGTLTYAANSSSEILIGDASRSVRHCPVSGSWTAG